MTSYVSVLGLVRQWIHFYVSLQRPGLSCRGAEVDSHGLAVQQTMVFPQLQFLYEVIDVPGMQGQVPSTAAVHQQGRLPPFRGAEADSHGLTVQADHWDSPIAVHTVVDVLVALVMQVPLYLAATLFGVHQWSTGLCPRNVRIQLSLVRQRIHAQASDHGGWFFLLRRTPRCFFLFCRSMMLGIMAGVVQKDSYSGMCQAGISGETLEIPQLQFLAGRRVPFRAAKTALHGPALSEDHRDFAVAVHGDRCPCCAGRAGSLPRRGAEAVSHGQACLADH